ncbi:hypothetical protein C8Q78DRAFT_960079 [Trametes maxima]|nr:hypothetical protein C8Q78DRAFT_960079 [Trametes maxima]
MDAQKTADDILPPKRLVPDGVANKLYSTWLSLIPKLVPDYLSYVQAMQGRIGAQSTFQDISCPSGRCTLKSSSILCLYSYSLVRNGLFPTAPSLPRIAVSIDLLDFYFALFERSADAVTALAAALKTLYIHRGFPIVNDKGEPIQDPFRRGLGYAVQWYDRLRSIPEVMVESALDECLQKLYPYVMIPINYTSNEWHSVPEESKEAPGAPPNTSSNTKPGQCSRLLQKRCPACFGGTQFGRSFTKLGGDVHIALDATFSQRHNVSAGESPWFYEPKYFISKEAVDAVGDRITAARKTNAKSYQSAVPESALDECEKSYEAADEKKEKTHGKKFDDTGLMALVCRHDIVLFLANIDTPGEQQKYAIALLEKLFEHLPTEATVAAFYDIGCVLDRSIHSYDFLPEDVVSRLIFATSVMHAYGHQWACQLVYNPRLREGLGWSEGEGTERIWSKFRKLIGVTRSSARSRRIWLLDRHADAINRPAREELGNWIRGKLKKGVDARSAAARKDLAETGLGLEELRQQWESQRLAQLSVRKHAPARLKKELDSVLNLLAELDTVETAMARLQNQVESGEEHPIVHEYIASLKRTHSRAVAKVEGLYASLNVPHDFPELKGLPLNFVRVLLMARDLKINIRKRAIGSFFEWDKLNRAAGGRDQPLGTKLHQQTQKAIAKRTPALRTAIKKFNAYCAELRAMYEDSWNIPLPQPLPTELAALRDDSSLLADVWITPVIGVIPRWLQDTSVRKGIRAMLALDRSIEERRRLGCEADNLCRWYGRELAAAELALQLPQYADISFLLQQKLGELVLLQVRWRNPLVSDLRFESHTEEAPRIAARYTGKEMSVPIRWVHIPFQDQPEEHDRADSDIADEETIIARDALEELLDYNDGDSDTKTMVSLPPVAHTQIVDGGRILPATSIYARYPFPVHDMARLRRPQGLLSDDCVNSGAQVLLRYFDGGANTQGGSPVLLSTRIMTLHRARADDERMWRDCARTEFWDRDVWIIPIHRPAPTLHWTLAMVYIKTKRIAYFDSFATTAVWEEDAKVLYALVYKLFRLSTEHGYKARDLDGDWVTYPLVSKALQHNGWDCGVWILACIGAILRGYHTVELSQEGIAEYRSRLAALVYTMTTPE